MMPILAMTSDEFLTIALAWVGAGGTLLTAVILLITKLLPSIAALKAQFDALHLRMDRQTTRQDAQEQTIAQVALAAQPSAPPAPVDADASPKN